MEMEEGACAALVVEHLRTETFSELVSDNSETELTGFACFTTEKGKKRKRGNLTDVSCSSYSSGAGSPLNLPFSLGFIGKSGFESTDDNSDSSRSKSLSGLPGYQSATTAVVSDSEDEIDFPNDVTDLDTFAVEFEPPETNSEDDDDDDNDDGESDGEPVIVIPSSSDEEDPGADGGDEYDIDSDSEDSWECPECWTINHPMTTKCLMCWKERASWVPQLNRTMSAPEPGTSKDNADHIIPTLTRSKTIPSANADVRPGSNMLLENKIVVSLSRSSSSCSSTTQTSCDSGICISSCETDTERTIIPLDRKNLCGGTSGNNEKDSETTKDLFASSASIITSALTLESHEETTAILPSDSSNTASTSSSDSQINTQTTEESSKDNDDSLRLCVICSTEPRNASIIHGRSGHQVCCITCAEKLKAAKKRCPVCRRRINLVIKNFL